MAERNMTPDERERFEANEIHHAGDEGRTSQAGPAAGRSDRRRDAEPSRADSDFDPTSRGDESGEVL